MNHDLRYSARSFIKHWRQNLVLIAVLAVGIASPTVVFSMMNTLAFRPPASADPERFIRIAFSELPASGVATAQDFAVYDSQIKSARLAAWSSGRMRVGLGHDIGFANALFVSCRFFEVFGASIPTAGRLLHEDECAGGAKVGVLSERAWRTRFNADPAIVGSNIDVAGSSVTVVGVTRLPPIQIRAHFADPDGQVDLMLPLTSQRAFKDGEWVLQGRDLLAETNRFPWLEIGGLLTPGRTRAEAQVELQLLAARRRNGAFTSAGIRVTDGSRWSVMPTRVVQFTAFLMLVPALITLAACVNVGTLLLPRASARLREMAVRLAIGAQRAALFRLLVIENLLLSTAAGVVSLGLVYMLPAALVRMFGADMWFSGAVFQPVWQVFVALAVVIMLTALGAVIAPALALRTALGPLSGRAVHSPAIARIGHWAVAAQVGVSMLLLIVATVTTRSFAMIAHPGIETTNLLIVSAPHESSSESSIKQLRSALDSAGLRTAYADTPPVIMEGAVRLRRFGEEEWLSIPAARISDGYFEILGLRTLFGRTLTAADLEVQGAEEPTLISSTLATKLFRGGESLGASLQTAEGQRLRIIGIVEDRLTGPTQTPTLGNGAIVYRPAYAPKRGVILVAPPVGGSVAPEAVRSILMATTGLRVPVSEFSVAFKQATSQMQGLNAIALGAALVSILLTLAGLGGVVSLEANRRKKEFAIRVAIGASPGLVYRRLVLSGLAMLPVGAVVGGLAAYGLLRLASSQRVLPVQGVLASPEPYVVAALLLVAAGTAVLLVVAHPITRNDPALLLRADQ